MRSYLKHESFRGQASIKTWMMTIAVNLVRDYERNRRLQFWRRLSISSADPDALSAHLPAVGVSPEKQALLNEQVRMIWEASRSLPEKQRTVFLLRFVEEMDLQEISGVTGMKEGTIKVHLFRALQAIRKKLGRLK